MVAVRTTAGLPRGASLAASRPTARRRHTVTAARAPARRLGAPRTAPRVRAAGAGATRGDVAGLRASRRAWSTVCVDGRATTPVPCAVGVPPPRRRRVCRHVGSTLPLDPTHFSCCLERPVSTTATATTTDAVSDWAHSMGP